ncbi:mas-related G-protein coupled receptor member D-like [Bombina bombina]|uniref:mas-related G-protein coupled receptor member D-like n=1 Tax=Bombina bombina TaxID=8345 RepID=UPI00235B1C9E|nr:mas-related G-protein coupled receptor member D-like [Bombina bombina]
MEFNGTSQTGLNTSEDQSGFGVNASIHFAIAASCAVALCLFGMLGNIIVFWYLCFRIPKNKYTVYIINLTAADFLFLTFTVFIMGIQLNKLIGGNDDFTGKEQLYIFAEIFYDFAQYSGMFFLTAISVERCLAVLFPIWYQCNRRKNQSSIVCICLWILGCSESLIENLACSPKDFMAQTNTCTGIEIMTFVISIGICLPLMVTSSLILLLRIQRTLRQQYPPRLYVIIITTVFVFILSVTPFSFMWFLMYFNLLPFDVHIVSLFYASVFCTVLNSTLNPYIYFIVGRHRKTTPKVSIHEILQRAFHEEEAKRKNNQQRSVY